MPKEAVILFQDESGLIPVFGVPCIKRLLIMLKQLGVEKIIVMGKSELYERLSSETNNTQFIYCPLNSPQTLREMPLGDMFKGSILVLKANHVVDKASLKKLIEKCGDPPCVLLGKSNEPIFLVSSKDLINTIGLLWENRSTEGLNSSSKRLEGIAGLPFSINGHEQVEEAEAMLIKALSLEKRDSDSPLAKYFDRNISLFFTKRLVCTGITPNQVTLMGMSIGLIGAGLLAMPNYWTELIGSLLFLFCVIIDGIDGEIARLKLKESQFGHYLDIITDNIVHIAVFIGMGLGLYQRTNNRLYLYLIGVLLIGFGLCAISVYQCILKKEKEELEKSPLLIKSMSLLTNRDFAYLVAILAIIDKLNWFFIMTAIGSYLFSGMLWIASYRHKKNYPADSPA